MNRITQPINHLLNFALTGRFKLIPDSAVLIAISRWMSGGIRTKNLPPYRLQAMGSGTVSLFLSISATTSSTSLRIPY